MRIHPTKNNKGQFFCKKCSTWKDSEDWYHNKNGKRDSMCKDCRKDYRKDAKKILSKEYYKEHREHYLELHKKWREENVEKKLWHSARGSAKKRNLEFSLEPEDIVIPEICPVLGIAIDTHAEAGTGRGNDWKQNPYRPSIDRFDSSKGYTKDNIRIISWRISWRANVLKRDASLDEMKRIYEWMLNEGG